MILKKSPSIVSSLSLNNSTISLPVVTSGITNGLYLVGRLFAKKNVIIPDMMWENYQLIFNDSELETFPLFDTNQTRGFNFLGLKKKLNIQGDKVILLNFPTLRFIELMYICAYAN